MMSHPEAKGILEAAFKLVFGRSPTLSERQAVQAVALLESGYGSGWSVEKGCAGSHNWGAVQDAGASEAFRSGAASDCGSNACGHGDSRPDGTKYAACFKVYPDDVSGAAGLVREMYQRRSAVLVAASRGDLVGVSRAMRDSTYYEGQCGAWWSSAAGRAYVAAHGRQAGIESPGCKAEAVAAHAGILESNVARIAAACGEPVALSRRSGGGVGAGLPLVLCAGAAGAILYLTTRKRRGRA